MFQFGDLPDLSDLPTSLVPDLELASTPVHEQQPVRTFISTPRPHLHASLVNQGLIKKKTYSSTSLMSPDS